MLKDLKTPFFTVLFIFLGFFLFTKIFGPIPFSINSVTTTKETLFTVDGEGEVTAIPDTAHVMLGVNKNAATVKVAQDEVNKIINQITQDIKNLGVDVKDIKTTNYSVNPSYDYTAGKQTITGYEVSATIDVKLSPLDKANQAIDLATKAGATQVGNVQFVLDDKKQKELEEQARNEAIKNAKEKAQSISKSAGIRLGRIVNIQENVSSNPRPYPYLNAMKAADAEQAPTTELNPGENKVTTTVSLSYETY